MRAGVGHIGSALSIVELLSVLYERVLRISGPHDSERDRFILSKGHAALALYAALHLKGLLSIETLDTYCGDDSRLGVHPEHVLAGVDFSTGSLGHGLSMGVGAALAARMDSSSRRVYVLVSDAECNEGSLWEAVMFSAHHRLSNLIAIVDDNAQQALGHTKDVIDLDPIHDRFRAFGWDTRVVDGHDEEAIADALREFERGADAPHALVARTTFGKGVSFMENRIEWHYLPMSDEQYRTALEEVRTP
jgi:transketolase